MYYYVLTSGEYSNYGIEGIVASVEPVDIRAKLTEMVAWLNEHPSGAVSETWYVPDERKAAAFQAVGLAVIDYEEINYDMVHSSYDYATRTDAPPSRWQLLLPRDTS